MAAVSTRSPREGAESVEMSTAALADATSSTSHASTSRTAGNLSSRTTSVPSTPGPLSLAEALSRSGGDYVAALDAVLAERNKFALDSAKLNSENVRIWNLMGRIRKENEAMKAKVLELERGGPGGSPSRGSPLGPAASISPASPVSTRRRLPGMWEAERAGSPLQSPRIARTAAYADPALDNRSGPGLVQGSDSIQSLAATQQDGLTSGSSQPALPSAASSGFQDSPDPTHDQNATRSPISPTQQISIIQQRAAAQAQTLSRGLHGSKADSLGSTESGDFEAVDRSSVSGTDEGSIGGPGVEPLTPITSSGPFGSSTGRLVQDDATPSHHRSGEAASRVLPSPSRSLSQTSVSAMSSVPERRSFASRAMTDDKIYSSPRNQRAKENGKRPALSPRLDASLLRVVGLRIVATNYKLAERGKEAISFVITTEILQPPASWSNPSSNDAAPPVFWTLEKNYSDILGLDARLRQKYGKKTAQRLAPLPDKNLFKDHAPAKVDQRKALLEIYLQSLLVLALPDKDDVCTFLCTDVVPDRVKNPLSTSKDGFLTKKGQNLGRWVTRFYVLRNSILNYYETRGGAQIGSINIKDAQIGRQQKASASGESDENSYRHAFLILEKRPGNTNEPPHIARHVLCAESEEERDEWVDVLVRAIAEMEEAALRDGSRLAAQTGPAGGLGQADVGSSRDTTSLRDRREEGNGVEATTSSSQDSAPTIQSKRSERDLQPLSPRAPTHGSEQPRGNVSRRETGEHANGGHVTGGAPPVQGHPALSVNSSIPPSVSSRVLAEPRSPVTRTGFTRESQDVPGSPGPRRDSLPRSTKPAISGPMNGAPIPTGYKFGAKDEPAVASQEGKKDDKKRFWQGFRGFGHHDKNANREPRPVFGVPLAESIAVSSIQEGLELPSVVYRCIEYLEKTNAAMEEGIYRLSGSSAVIKTLKDRFNAEGDVDLLANDQYYDPHAIAGLLKTFLRELPTSVLTRELHLDFMRLNEIEDRNEKLNELGHLVSLLPLANYSLLRTLCSHLIKIIEHADVNKMTMRNVGIVFSPTLAIGAGIFALFLTEFDNVFFTDAKGEPASRLVEEDILAPDASELGIAEDGSAAGPTSDARTSLGTVTSASHSSQPVQATKSARSKRNSLQYRESQADRLLGLEGRRLDFIENEEDYAGIGSAASRAGELEPADEVDENIEVPVRRL